MRKLRDLPWGYIVFGVPAIVGAVFFQYFLRTRPGTAPSEELGDMIRPSYFMSLKNKSAKGAVLADGGTEDDELSDEDELDPRDFGISFGESSGPNGLAAGLKAHPAKVQGDDDEYEVGGSGGFPDDEPMLTRAKDDDGTPKLTTFSAKRATPAAREVAALPEKDLAVGAANQCLSIEYRGDGMQLTKLTRPEWAQAMNAFKDMKYELQAWLEEHRLEFSDRTVALMARQLKKLKIQRPPAQEEPDLSWRGIGVWTQTKEGDPMIRIGNGLVKLVMKQPKRAKFEMMRLVAQTWAPCELQRIGAQEAWEPLLKCIGVDEQNACAPGSYSDSGWAVSTVLATVLANPGCKVPALAPPELAHCLKRIPLPLSLSDNLSVPRVWKEARR